jgi:hypothetical protein
MNEMHYLDFDLQIARAAAEYRVEVNSPAGQSASTFTLPFSELELENFLLKLGHTGRGMRRLDAPEVAAAKAFGARLFDTVFAGDIRACLRSSLDEASQRNVGLRIRLRLTDAPELADLPWEYLYHSASNRFLSLSATTPLVRYLDLPERIRPLAVNPPLRMLVMISSPRGAAPLDMEREWRKLGTALGDLEQRGLVVLERIPATLSALQQKLRRNSYHILHFIGHGGFDKRTQDGVLLLEDEDGESDRVSGQDLGTLLHDHRSLRIAVLNACEGARGSRTDPFAGTAQSLVQQGLPAVIAMQFEVSDEAAITLAHEFYGAIADSYPVDAALAEARKALFAAGNRVEWGTPVLYLRAPDGKIFDVAAGAVVSVRPSAPVAMPEASTASGKLAPQVPTTRAEEPTFGSSARPHLPVNDARLLRARAAALQARWAEALALYEELASGYTLSEQAESDLAQARYEAALERQREAAVEAAAKQDWARAVQILEALVPQRPNDPELAQQLGKARVELALAQKAQEAAALTGIGEWGAADVLLQQIAKMRPEYRHPTIDIPALQQKAHAVRAYRQATELAKQDDWAAVEATLAAVPKAVVTEGIQLLLARAKAEQQTVVEANKGMPPESKRGRRGPSADRDSARASTAKTIAPPETRDQPDSMTKIVVQPETRDQADSKSSPESTSTGKAAKGMQRGQTKKFFLWWVLGTIVALALGGGAAGVIAEAVYANDTRASFLAFFATFVVTQWLCLRWIVAFRSRLGVITSIVVSIVINQMALDLPANGSFVLLGMLVLIVIPVVFWFTRRSRT